MAYEVALYLPARDDDGARYMRFERSVNVRTVRQARKLAGEWLAPHMQTSTWELRHHAHVAEVCISKAGRGVDCIQALEYVDSIATRLRRGEAVAV